MEKQRIIVKERVSVVFRRFDGPRRSGDPMIDNTVRLAIDIFSCQCIRGTLYSNPDIALRGPDLCSSVMRLRVMIRDRIFFFDHRSTRILDGCRRKSLSRMIFETLSRKPRRTDAGSGPEIVRSSDFEIFILTQRERERYTGWSGNYSNSKDIAVRVNEMRLRSVFHSTRFPNRQTGCSFTK